MGPRRPPSCPTCTIPFGAHIRSCWSARLRAGQRSGTYRGRRLTPRGPASSALRASSRPRAGRPVAPRGARAGSRPRRPRPLLDLVPRTKRGQRRDGRVGGRPPRGWSRRLAGVLAPRARRPPPPGRWRRASSACRPRGSVEALDPLAAPPSRRAEEAGPARAILDASSGPRSRCLRGTLRLCGSVWTPSAPPATRRRARSTSRYRFPWSSRRRARRTRRSPRPSPGRLPALAVRGAPAIPALQRPSGRLGPPGRGRRDASSLRAPRAIHEALAALDSRVALYDCARRSRLVPGPSCPRFFEPPEGRDGSLVPVSPAPWRKRRPRSTRRRSPRGDRDSREAAQDERRVPVRAAGTDHSAFILLWRRREVPGHGSSPLLSDLAGHRHEAHGQTPASPRSGPRAGDDDQLLPLVADGQDEAPAVLQLLLEWLGDAGAAAVTMDRVEGRRLGQPGSRPARTSTFARRGASAGRRHPRASGGHDSRCVDARGDLGQDRGLVARAGALPPDALATLQPSARVMKATM